MRALCLSKEASLLLVKGPMWFLWTNMDFILRRIQSSVCTGSLCWTSWCLRWINTKKNMFVVFYSGYRKDDRKKKFVPHLLKLIILLCIVNLFAKVGERNMILCPPSSPTQRCCTDLSPGPSKPEASYGIGSGSIQTDVITNKIVTGYGFWGQLTNCSKMDELIYLQFIITCISVFQEVYVMKLTHPPNFFLYRTFVWPSWPDVCESVIFFFPPSSTFHECFWLHPSSSVFVLITNFTDVRNANIIGDTCRNRKLNSKHCLCLWDSGASFEIFLVLLLKQASEHQISLRLEIWKRDEGRLPGGRIQTKGFISLLLLYLYILKKI